MALDLYIHDFSLITCLEHDLDGILAADLSGMMLRDDLVHGRNLRFGTIRSGILPDAPVGKLNARCNMIASFCLQKLKDRIANLLDRHGKDRVGAIIGSSNGSIHEAQAAVEHYASTGEFPDYFGASVLDVGLPSEFIAACTGASGPSYTISTACTSSGKAFSAAARLIGAGACDAAIVGGIDPLCTYASNGFYALEALSEGYSNPFSKNRDGITIGEAGALFVVSREKSILKIMGIGETSDAHHMTSPDPSGSYAAKAMQMALDSAGIKPQDVGYINLHGTGTQLNDSMESRAVFDIFGDNVPCSSLKPLIGHTLGACAAAELAHCCLLLDKKLNPQERIPPHPWDGVADPALAPIRLSDGGTVADLRYIVSNSFAFGGSNVSIVLGLEQ